MTSASIVKEALEMMGAEARVICLTVLQMVMDQTKVSTSTSLVGRHLLIVTVDNGVAGMGLPHAQEQGVDVIVTDHHSMPAQLPDAYAIVHQASRCRLSF
ncbi:MAG: DHH family phosphoesterase [Streptococcus sp.]